FLATDGGIVYAKPETIADKHNISSSTVSSVLTELTSAGLITTVYRTSRKQNGRGNAVRLITIHPYFDHIKEFLNLDWKADKKADWKAENAETPCESKDESDNSTPTYSFLPTLSTDFNNS